MRAIKVQYEEYPFVLDVQEAMKDGAPQLHKNFPNNILKHTTINKGNYEEAIKEPGLIKIEGWYETPPVQHCHIENFICTAEMEGDRITIVASTQIPHIVRRVVGQALGVDWGKIRVIKPYICLLYTSVGTQGESASREWKDRCKRSTRTSGKSGVQGEGVMRTELKVGKCVS